MISATVIAVGWKHAEGKFEIKVRIPRGVTALIVMPNGTRSTQGGGTRIYSCDLPNEFPRR